MWFLRFQQLQDKGSNKKHKGKCACRSLQLEKKQLEERLEGLRADSSSQAESRPSAVTSPRGTAVLRALRNENEHLKQQLQVHPHL